MNLVLSFDRSSGNNVPNQNSGTSRTKREPNQSPMVGGIENTKEESNYNKLGEKLQHGGNERKCSEMNSTSICLPRSNKCIGERANHSEASTRIKKTSRTHVYLLSQDQRYARKTDAPCMWLLSLFTQSGSN